jgi:hypothetical protein
MHRATDCFVFAGPSLPTGGLGRAVTVVPPAARGDVARLTGDTAPAVLVLADGKFHQDMSVGHAELRDAIERGWDVWGVSSLGASRAYEMRSLGMRGYGRVYRLFYRFEDFQDDELALVHEPDPPYRAASEPLVHMRFALDALVRAGALEMRGALDVLRSLKVLWYGERTLALFGELVQRSARPGCEAIAGDAIKNFNRFRVKQQDLAAIVAARPWRRHRTPVLRS